MSDYSDLVKRLPNHVWVPIVKEPADVIAELEKRVAELQQEVCSLIRRDPNDDLIERQAARINELEAALKPFANLYRPAPCSDGDTFIVGVPSVSDLRQARKILGERE